jgi:hypothetical protein
MITEAEKGYSGLENGGISVFAPSIPMIPIRTVRISHLLSKPILPNNKPLFHQRPKQWRGVLLITARFPLSRGGRPVPLQPEEKRSPYAKKRQFSGHAAHCSVV